VSELSRAQLAAMVDEATVDCHDEDEQVTGLHTMLVETLQFHSKRRSSGWT